jgi:hypothetical protein
MGVVEAFWAARVRSASRAHRLALAYVAARGLTDPAATLSPIGIGLYLKTGSEDPRAGSPLAWGGSHG